MARPKGDGRGRQGGGRQKGTPNKVTVSMRKLLAGFCEEHFDDFVAAFKRIDEPKEKCVVYLKAQEFVTPKLSAVDLKDSASQGRTLQDELDELSAEK